MKCLAKYLRQYTSLWRRDNLSLSLEQPLPDAATQQLLKLYWSKDADRRWTGPLSSYPQLFVKTVRFDTLPSMLRATFGLRRAHGEFDWPIAELINTLEAAQRRVPVPKVLGFGVRRNRWRLTRQIMLLTQTLSDYVDGKQWLADPRCELDIFVSAMLRLVVELNEQGVYHLDLWLGNVMLDPQNPGRLKAIDLENAYVGEVGNLARVLGFQFGHLYLREINELMPESRYDELVEALLPSVRGLDRGLFDQYYRLCKHHHYSRKGRRQLAMKN